MQLMYICHYDITIFLQKVGDILIGHDQQQKKKKNVSHTPTWQLLHLFLPLL